MTIEEYRLTFDRPDRWFAEEVNKGYHKQRISKVIANRNYLLGDHKVKLRGNSKFKGKELITRKTILNYAKTILSFHDNYILGKPVSLSGDNEIVKTFKDIYKRGLYETVDYTIIDRVNKFGDAYEVVFVDNGIIKSRILDSADGYPIYTDSGEYISFIEHWTDAYSSISYYNVFYPNYVEHWTNEGGSERLMDTKINVIGLPIHYHNFSDNDYMFGDSVLTDIKPLLDDLEDVISKMGDAIYVNSLNPLPVAFGQRIDGGIPADATGYVLNLDNGDYKVVSTMMDYNTIKLYLDNIKQFIMDISNFPSVLGNNTNIANVSEVSLQLLFHMASTKAFENEKWLNVGFQDRFKKFRDILKLQGISVEGDTQVEVDFNLSIPVATNEIVGNMKAMREMGAISIDTVMEKCDYIKDVSIEKDRINKESKDNISVQIED